MYWEERRRYYKLFLRCSIAVSVIFCLILFLFCYKGYGIVFEKGWLAFLLITAIITFPVLSKLQPVSFWIFIIIIIFTGGLLGASAGSIQRKLSKWMITAHCTKLVHALEKARKTPDLNLKLEQYEEISILNENEISFQQGEYRAGKPYLTNLEKADVTVFISKTAGYYLVVPVTITDMKKISLFRAFIIKPHHQDWEYVKLERAVNQ